VKGQHDTDDQPCSGKSAIHVPFWIKINKIHPEENTPRREYTRKRNCNESTRAIDYLNNTRLVIPGDGRAVGIPCSSLLEGCSQFSFLKRFGGLQHCDT
jgi:hypothetical protein